MEFYKSNSILSSDLYNSSFQSSDTEDDNYPWLKLIKHLNNFYLDALHAVFKEKCYSKNPKKCNLQIGINKEEFINGINEIFGKLDYTNHAITIFNEIDKDDKRSITWEQFLCFLSKHLKPTFEKKLELSEPSITSIPHVKRETIIKIVCIETEKYFCYAIISKHGCVGLYDGNVNFLTSYFVIMTREDVTRTDEDRRKKNRWITDAIFLEDILMLVVTNTSRSLIIYDASGLTHIPLWLILGIPNILMCLTYCKESENVIYAGNERGEFLSFKFMQANVSLLRKKHNDKLSLFYWQELRNEKDFLVIKRHGKVQSENINHIQYFPHNRTIVLCSRDPEKSIVIKQMDNKIKPYIFKMKWGCNCFYLSKKLQILATGSEDGSLRIWNVVITSRPTAILKSHRCGIIDIVVIENLNIVLSCSRDGVFKIWALKEETCLQTLKLKFPPFKVKGRTIEWGINTIYSGPKRNINLDDQILENDIWERSNILVACCNYVATINLMFLDNQHRNLEMGILPPPPLQNSVLIPTNWKIGSEVNYDCENEINNDKLEKYIESLKFIIDKDFLTEECLNNDINFKIAKLESKKLEMHDKVVQCAPYLALDLQTVEEIKLSPDLPIPTRKKTQRLIEKTNRLLSAASYKSMVFSEASTSSKSRSSRSSIIEFD